MDFPMHAYRAFGLTIHSELEFSEFPSDDELGRDADLTVRFGEVPRGLLNATARGARFEATSEQLILTVDGHARFLAAHGREIVIARDPGASTDSIRTFLLGSVIGAILHQRRVLPLSASAVQVGDGAVLLMGASGVGKSTLAAALAQRGHRVVCDEIAGIVLCEGRPHVLTGSRQLNIWADVAETLGHNIADLHQVRPGLEKYALHSSSGSRFESLPIAKGYILSTTNTAELKTEVVHGVAKVTALVAQTFRPSLLADPSSRARHFAIAVALARAVTLCNLVRSRLPLQLERMADLVEDKLSS